MSVREHIIPKQWIRLTCPNSLAQWDANRTIYVPDCEEVHFAMWHDRQCLVVLPYEDDDGYLIADIPNQLLTRAGALSCWAVRGDRSIAHATFTVHAKPQPDDYVLEPTEVVDIIEMLESLNDRVTALEEGETGSRGMPAKIGAITITRIEGESYADVKLADSETNTYDIEMYLGYAYDEDAVRQLVDQRMTEYEYEINENGELLQMIN